MCVVIQTQRLQALAAHGSADAAGVTQRESGPFYSIWRVVPGEFLLFQEGDGGLTHSLWNSGKDEMVFDLRSAG